jgi:hypothetical protein
MSIGTGIFLVALGISGVKEKKREYDNKKEKYYLPNGIPYYIHRGMFYLYSGEKFVWWGDVAKTLDGRVLYDAGQKRQLIKNKETNEKIEKAKEKGLLYYTDNVPRCRSSFTFIEVSTRKPLARIQRKKLDDGSYECRKWYWYDEYAAKYTAEQLTHLNRTCTTHAQRIKDGDSGIIITEEEFDLLHPQGNWYNSDYCHDEKIATKYDLEDWKMNKKLYGDEWGNPR